MKFFILILISSLLLFAQNEKTDNLKLKVIIKNGELTSWPKNDTYRGSIFNNGFGLGLSDLNPVEDPLNFNYNELMFQKQNKSDKSKQSDKRNKFGNDITKLKFAVNFSIVILKVNKDNTIDMCLKVAVYDQIKSTGDCKYNMNLEYDREFFKIKIGEKIKSKTLSALFREDIKLLISYESKTQPDLVNELNYNYKINNQKIKTTLAKEAVINNKLQFGMEYIRTDKSNAKIVVQKSVFPLSIKNNLIDNTDINTGNKNIYEAVISVPFKSYDKNKNSAELKNIEDLNLSSRYSVVLIPVSENINTIKVKAYITCEHLAGKTQERGGIGFQKYIDISKEGSVKIELPENNYKSKFVSGDNRLVEVDVAREFSPFVKEYLIISLEKN